MYPSVWVGNSNIFFCEGFTRTLWTGNSKLTLTKIQLSMGNFHLKNALAMMVYDIYFRTCLPKLEFEVNNLCDFFIPGTYYTYKSLDSRDQLRGARGINAIGTGLGSIIGVGGVLLMDRYGLMMTMM